MQILLSLSISVTLIELLAPSVYIVYLKFRQGNTVYYLNPLRAIAQGVTAMVSKSKQASRLHNFDDLEVNETPEAIRPSVGVPFYQEQIVLTGEAKQFRIVVERDIDAHGRYYGSTYYLVTPEIAEQLPDLVKLFKLHHAVGDLSGDCLIPESLSTGNRKSMWSISLSKILNENQSKNFYIHRNAEKQMYYAVEEDFGIEFMKPSMSFSELLNAAFKDRVISTFNHPVVERLTNQ